MSNITQSKNLEKKLPDYVALPVKASTKIFGGGMVCLDSAGYCIKGANTAGVIFVGMSDDIADNTSGSDGTIDVKCKRTGVVKFVASSMAITDVGKKVYISDDQTVALAGSGINGVLCGRIVKYVSATAVWVDIDVNAIRPQTMEVTININAPTVNVTTYQALHAVGQNLKLKRATIGSYTKPNDADGTLLLNLFNWDSSGTPAADALLASADFDLEGLTAKTSEDLTLTATAADLIFAAGDLVYLTIVNDSGAIDTNLNGVITLEFEILD